MARGDQFRLIILSIFFIHSLVAFAIFAGLGWLLNYSALKNRPVSWHVAGSIGVMIWVVRNVIVHAVNPYDRLNMDVLWVVIIPALALLAIVWFSRLFTIPVK